MDIPEFPHTIGLRQWYQWRRRWTKQVNNSYYGAVSYDYIDIRPQTVDLAEQTTRQGQLNLEEILEKIDQDILKL